MKISTVRVAQLLVLCIEIIPLIFFGQSVALTFALWTMAALVGAILAVELLSGPAGIKFSTVLAATLLLAYAGGGLVALAVTIGILGQSNVTVMNEVSISDLNSGMAFICLACTFLLSFGLFEPPLLLPNQTPLKFERCIIIVLVAIGITIYCYLEGLMSQGGSVLFEDNRVSAFSSVASLLNPACVGFAAYCLARAKTKSIKIYFLVALGVLLLLLIPQGRRTIIYSLFLAGMFWQMGRNWENWNAWKKLNLKTVFSVKKVMPVVIGLFFAWYAAKFFFAIRVANYELSTDGFSAPLWDQIVGATTLMSGANDELGALLLENLGSRPLILDYFSMLVAAARQGQGGTGGLLLLNAVIAAVPAVMFPGKAAYVYFMPEEITNPAFGLPVTDLANSVVTDFFSDFLWFGIAFGPIFVVIFFRFCIRIFKDLFCAELFLLAAASVIYNLLQPETTSSTYLVALRDLFICLVLLTGIDMLYGLYRGKGRGARLKAHK